MFGEAHSLKKLANEFAKMPGIGRKSAWKLAFYILTLSNEQVENFSKTILSAHKNVKRCSICQNLTDSTLCEVCGNKQRNSKVICVVETSKDVIAFEKSRSFNGTYHVLHGLISPIDGVGPDELTIKQLLNRVKDRNVEEIILATNPTVEGEATAMFLSELFKPLKIVVSRLAYGIPVGSELQYADELTISKALENRSILRNLERAD